MPPHPSQPQQQQQPYGAYPQAPQPGQPSNPYGAPAGPTGPYQYSNSAYGQPASYPPAPTTTNTYHQQPQPQPQQQQPQQQKPQSSDQTTSFDTQHTDVIHDAQLDYYGRRLATASSDRSVRVFTVEPGQEPTLQSTLTGHSGPVWQVSWAHPQFGAILGSCSFDGTVCIWRESPPTGTATTTAYGKPTTAAWQKIKEHKAHEGSSVNAIAWAPHDCGLRLACASSDGRVSVLSCNVDTTDQQWESVEFHAHAVGCNAVTWAPHSSANLLLHSQPRPQNDLLLATGGCDNLIRMWTWSESEHGYVQHGPALEGHSDWIRDVSFNPSDRHLLASCSQDRTVRIWTESEGAWTSQPLSKEPFADSLWRLSWSVAGALLAVAGGDNKITLWRDGGAGAWEMTGTVDN